MRVLIVQSRFLLGGSETYAVTVAEQLEQLGHPVEIFAGEASDKGRELAGSRGLRLVTGDLSTLADRDDFDAAIAQDAAGAYALAARDSLPQIFVIHGRAAFEHPPEALRPAPRVVVLNDRIGNRAAALAGRPEVIRLRQPIDIDRFRPRGPARERAQQVLVFSNYIEQDRLAMLQAACDDLGLELTSMGTRSTTSVTPQERIAEADIVVGYGRSVLEGMVMGRAAYVWERSGGDGWVTPDSYAAIEADGFSGGATDAIIDTDRLRRDLAAYSPELGTLARDLARKHHSAATHTEALVQLLGRAEAPAPDPLHETLGTLVRAQARAADDANQFEFQLRVKAEETEALRAEVGELRSALEHSKAATEAERQARLAAEEHLRNVQGSISWRLTRPLRRLTEALRALRGRSVGS